MLKEGAEFNYKNTHKVKEELESIAYKLNLREIMQQDEIILRKMDNTGNLRQS